MVEVIQHFTFLQLSSAFGLVGVINVTNFESQLIKSKNSNCTKMIEVISSAVRE